MSCPVKNLFSFFLKCTFAKRNEFSSKRQAKPVHLPEKEPFSKPEHMKFGKLKFGIFMNRNSSASSPVVWSNERSCFSTPGEGPWSYSHFHLQNYSRHVQMGNWRLALGWDNLFTTDVCQRIAGGQHRYLPTIVNKPWFEEREKGRAGRGGRGMSTGPLADLVASNPGCECPSKDSGGMTKWYVTFH